MRNEKLFVGLVKSYVKASDKYNFSIKQWKQDYKNSFIACESGTFESYQKYLVSKMSMVFPYMFVDKVIPMLDKTGNAVWKIDLNVQLDNGVVFLFLTISLNQKFASARVMANRELFNSDFELTDLIIKHDRLKKSQIVFNNSVKSNAEYFLGEKGDTPNKEIIDDKSDVEFRSNVSHLSQLHLPQLKQSKPIQQPFVSYRRSHQYMLV
jgi:hypothetical protein